MVRIILKYQSLTITYITCSLEATYVGTQISCLRLANRLRVNDFFWRDTIPTDLSMQKDLELEWFCNYPHSSYNVSMERFLSKVPLSAFIRLTRWIPTERLKDILCSHLAPLIKPHIQHYLKDPESFAHFLCWAAYVPDSELAINSCGDAVANHCWPGDLRQIVLAHTENPENPENPEPLSTFGSIDIKKFTNLFSLPSINFLHDALFIVLKTVELELRHSRRYVDYLSYDLAENVALFHDQVETSAQVRNRRRVGHGAAGPTNP
ncbi:hypothetical protein BJ165DRAFT_1467878 [Panaeolus papilionaceus]|nr:hypothetical protein BJ165DRAFT_1467878 [Panaeolus papilionaceus]